MKLLRLGIAIQLLAFVGCSSDSSSDPMPDAQIVDNTMDAMGNGGNADATTTPAQDAGTTPSADADTSVDTTPALPNPTVASTSPTQGQLGVTADATIVITFSKPMDQASVMGAVTSNTLGGFSLSWDAASTVLTITPGDELSYAFGNNTRTYDVTVGVGAMDMEGNALLAPFELTFNTLRQVQSTLMPVLDKTFNYNSVSMTTGSNLYVGDGANNGREKGFVTFDLTELPADAVEILDATFSTFQQSVAGTPFVSLSPNVRLDTTTWDTPGQDNVGTQVGNISTSRDMGAKSTNAAAVVQTWFANNATEGKFAMKFIATSDNDNSYDRVLFLRNMTRLVVTYLQP